MRFSSARQNSFVETTDDESRVTRSHRNDSSYHPTTVESESDEAHLADYFIPMAYDPASWQRGGVLFTQGAYGNLMVEFWSGPEEFENFHRVNPTTLDFLLMRIDGVIIRQDMSYRQATDGLSTALRYAHVTKMLNCDLSVEMRRISCRVFDPLTLVQQKFYRFNFQIGPTVALVKPTNDFHLWCIQTTCLRFSVFCRLCIQ